MARFNKGGGGCLKITLFYRRESVNSARKKGSNLYSLLSWHHDISSQAQSRIKIRPHNPLHAGAQPNGIGYNMFGWISLRG